MMSSSAPGSLITLCKVSEDHGFARSGLVYHKLTNNQQFKFVFELSSIYVRDQ